MRPWWSRLFSERAESGGPAPVRFRCNVCGQACEAVPESMGREIASCRRCGSTVRFRAIVHHVSQAVFGRSLALPDFPRRPDVRGVGLSDWQGYARGLARKFSYVNTFYDRSPRLDITAITAERAGSCDFLISTEVFEHIAPPVSRAFEGARRLLKPGGSLILTVPFALEFHTTQEHYPQLHDWRIVRANGRRRLVNRRADGTEEVFDDLVFHGGRA